MQSWFTPLVIGSTVYYTYPVSLYYMRKVVVVGELAEESTKELIKYCCDHI
jgi:hypothetical protein